MYSETGTATPGQSRPGSNVNEGVTIQATEQQNYNLTAEYNLV